MSISIACGGLADVVPNHELCDGTQYGNARDDAAFMASMRPAPCECACHRAAPTCPECGSPMFPSGYYQYLRCSNYEGCEEA